MKKHFYFLACFLLVTGCAAKTTPEWIKTSHHQLESYKTLFLQGRDALAERSFQKAFTEMKSGGDLRLMQIAYLTRYALQTAVLDGFDDQDYHKLDAVDPHTENRQFLALLRGAFDMVDEKHLPMQYQRYLSACKSGKQAEIDHTIEAIEDPLSRLIASGIAVRKQLYSEKTLHTAIRTAAGQGWKKGLISYLMKLRDFYTSINEQNKADVTQQRIDLLQ